ncbi:N-acetylglucosamine-6-phosphate deacetylase [Mesobacillus maritimus]|uniref:N-acetylglucosamine-6-phosphate deacetylase n=1 Tax=Mesobacillus maritimus TaxID=1643336 RepID=UPI00203AEC06|nr:N-acetylglucosamine-6-phosphate deacetylase [Mesobacillus maritimus]MCM3588230.1 N-acetylglucosamine-6-phosphate deacetylase [Mesobacillus maritimus]
MTLNKTILLKGMQLYTENEKIENSYLLIKDQKIIDYGSLKNLSSTAKFDEVVEVPTSFKAVPGFIDIHIHGVNGADVMDATPEALETMSTALPKEGTTSFLATTMTQSSDAIENALKNVGEFLAKNQPSGQAEILGAHLEGPFVNAKRAGAQPVQHIVDSNLEVFQKWNVLTGDTIRVVTLAPEQPGGLEFVKHLKENNIIASIGHSDATYEEVVEAIEAGASHVTHLFNQMRGLHHREPGVVGAAFLHDELTAEIIADGVHVRPEMVKLAYKNKGKDRLILITDSMRAKCLKNGVYDLGGQDVTVKDGKALLQDGTLAGSILRLGDGLKNMVDFTECALEDVIQMTSVNPAKQLNVYDHKGSISVGKDADIVILDDDLNVFMTFCRGKLAYHQGGEES